MERLTKLGLGGHSFIEQLGNDHLASFEEQCAIVSACLDSGIRLIDTTYYQERVALGNVLKTLNRRNEAEIIAWNFFKQTGKENELVGYTPYESRHIEIMLKELQTDYIDILVIHTHDDTQKLHQELELVEHWVAQGKVKKIALGMVKLEHLEQLPVESRVSLILAPYNAFNQGTLATFQKACDMGFSIVALSPFIRGWKLDEIKEDPATTSGILLRWVTSQEIVDHVIVSMRKREWVTSNLHAERLGSLGEPELKKLNGWIETLS